MAENTPSTRAAVKKTPFIWLDGALVPWDDANVHVMSTGLHYGLGTFEGIRAYRCADGRSAVFRLQDHLKRLYDTAHLLLLEMPFSIDRLTLACLELLEANKMKDAYLRPLAFMGDGAMGLGALNPMRVAVMTWEWGRYLGDEALKSGIRAKVSSFSRMHVNANLLRGKITGQYINSVLAKREAKLAGYDEALLLDTQGYLAEASGENLFMVRKGQVFTPPLTSPILEGVTRATLIRLLHDEGIEVREETFTRDTLYLADEAFLCGTAAEVTPIREVDDRRIGSGKRGPITALVQERFFQAARGEQPAYAEWLTYYGN